MKQEEKPKIKPIGLGDRRQRRGYKPKGPGSRFKKLQLIKISPAKGEEFVEEEQKQLVPVFVYIRTTHIFKLKDGSTVTKYDFKRILYDLKVEYVTIKKRVRPIYKTIVQYNYPSSLGLQIAESKKRYQTWKEEMEKKKDEKSKEAPVVENKDA